MDDALGGGICEKHGKYHCSTRFLGCPFCGIEKREVRIKITDRIKNIDGVKDCHYDFNIYKLVVHLNKKCDRERVEIVVAKLISDLQLQGSIKFIDFYFERE